MESNKEEAVKCLRLAEKFFASGHNEKGIKFVQKSLHLYPTKKAEELLEQHGKNGVNANGYVNSNNEETASQPNEVEAEVHTATPEEIDEVKKITKCKDFYEVLGVSKEFTESEIKKQYRKKALKFHPDKNRTPGADEAFKRIGNAFAVLNDPAKRRRYDEVGEDTGPELRRNHSHNDGFEGDISPEDLFNMFFGGGFPQGNVRVHRQRRGNQFFAQTTNQQQNQNGPQQDSSYYPLIQVLPILLIVLFSMLSSLLIPEPLYSFQSTSQYRYSMTTENLGVLYFVKDKDLGEKRGSNEFKQLERQIEKTHVENLEVKCYRERQYQQELLHQARIWGNPDLRRRAQNFQMEACNQLSALGVR